jgi:hypothetical protein
VIFELERQQSPVVIVAHQAVLRCLYAYFLDVRHAHTLSESQNAKLMVACLHHRPHAAAGGGGAVPRHPPPHGEATRPCRLVSITELYFIFFFLA